MYLVSWGELAHCNAFSIFSGLFTLQRMNRIFFGELVLLIWLLLLRCSLLLCLGHILATRWGQRHWRFNLLIWLLNLFLTSVCTGLDLGFRSNLRRSFLRLFINFLIQFFFLVSFRLFVFEPAVTNGDLSWFKESFSHKFEKLKVVFHVL